MPFKIKRFLLNEIRLIWSKIARRDVVKVLSEIEWMQII